MISRIRIVLQTSFLGLAVTLPSLAFANDLHWPEWRGPQGDGTATDADPPLEWGEDQNIAWKVTVPGQGHGSPIVLGDKIFLLAARSAATEDSPANDADSRPDSPPADRVPPSGRGRRGRGSRGAPPPTSVHQFLVLCYDLKTGELIWERVAREEIPHEGHHGTNTFASGSAVTDGESVYAFFGSRGIHCYDLEGNKKWDRDFGEMQTRNGFGEGATPAVYGNTIVVPWDQEGPSAVFALNKANGDILWQKERDEPTTWATPLIVEHDNQGQVILSGTNRVRSYALDSGDLLWECGGQATNPIPTPVLLGDTVFCMTGYRGYAIYAIPLSARGDITGTDKIKWSRDDAAPYVSSPVLYKGYLYFTKSRNGVLSVIDANTGEPILNQVRLPGIDSLYASPVAADDRIYFTGRSGTTVVLKHGNELEVLATNLLGEGVDASPALVGDQIIIRGQNHLYCIGK